MDYEASFADFRQLVSLQAPHVDVFLIETMSNITEAKAALAAVKETAVPAYVGLTVADDGTNTLRSGETLPQAIDQLFPLGPAGLMINCSVPEAVSAAMSQLKDLPIPFGGYANGFTSIDALRPGGTVASLRARSDPVSYTHLTLPTIE